MAIRDIFRRRHTAEKFTIVTAVRKGDNISFTESGTCDSRRAVLARAEELARDIADNTLIAVIEWTGRSHWRDGRRIAYYGGI